MLYKNDEGPLKLNPAEIKAIESFFHNKFPVKVVYPPERIVPSKLKHNRLPDKPNSISFDMKATVKTNSGTEVWRYAENVTVDAKGVKKYTPKKFIFNGARFLDRNEIELIYFLLRKSQYCKGGENEGRFVKFMFEDLVSDAEKKVAKKQAQSKVDMLLYNEEMGLSADRLKEIAKAYHIKNVDLLSLPQIKIAIEIKIKETKDGAEKFFDMIDNESEIKTKVSIQKAIDMELLKYDAAKKTWIWKVKDGKDIQVCKVPPNKTANEAIYDYHNGNLSFREELVAALITSNPMAGKGKGGSNLEEE